jgi:hypothetical protein
LLNEFAQKENGAAANKDDSKQTPPDAVPLLRVAPKRGISIVAPSVRSGEFITSSRISLLSYEEKFGAGKEAVEEHLKQVNMSTFTRCSKVKRLYMTERVSI